MKLLNDYFTLQKKIYKYFGYEEDWRVIPLDDGTEYYWAISGYDSGDTVRFAKTKKILLDLDDGEHYSNDIYTQRHLDKWVYKGEDYTMVVVDTNTDGNKFLQIFDNMKEIPYEDLNHEE